MKRVYNFSAGPAMLPESVLQRAANEMLDYNGSGQSVMEMSHRSKVYEEIIFGCEALFRECMSIPSNYKILFLQGGATSQFSMVPINLMNGSGKADYAITGQFSKKAYDEASRFGACHVVASSKDQNFSYIPEFDPSNFDKDADYFHICSNNTIFGTRFTEIPDTGSVPLVSDMSSFILSEPIDVSKYGLIYAGAQKNIGPSGLTVVIIRDDLIGRARENTPIMYNYQTYSDNDSMYNTPPTYAIYICKMVLEWIKGMGGIEKLYELNVKKSNILYNYLDSSNLFKGTAVKKDRSLMNVTFVTGDVELDKKFASQADKAGFVNIKGHRSVGGMRASIYNAMPIEGLEALVAFMKEFEAENK